MSAPSLRLGLCCKFLEVDIGFRTTTARHLQTMPRELQLEKLGGILRDNAAALLTSIEYCRKNRIGCFRINSQIWPLKTHPQVGYELSDLPDSEPIARLFRQCREVASAGNIRLTFHPDQFILLNSPREDVVSASRRDLLYQAEVAELVGADVINIHGGGLYDRREEALDRLTAAVLTLPEQVRSRLTLENDDRVFTPSDLLPVCRATGVPLVYDVHHHRCLKDGLTVEEATKQALSTWNREPLFHISSPREGYDGGNPRPHHDYIDIRDFPACWRNLPVTVEVEAKAKEKAVLALMRELAGR